MNRYVLRVCYEETRLTCVFESKIGGGSPILRYTEAQGSKMAALLEELRPSEGGYKNYTGFRYVSWFAVPPPQGAHKQVQLRSAACKRYDEGDEGRWCQTGSRIHVRLNSSLSVPRPLF